MTFATTESAPPNTAVRHSRWPLTGVSQSEPGLIEAINRPAALLSIVPLVWPSDEGTGDVYDQR
jgi:hypothetical protein